MHVDDMLSASFQLLILGMGTVFFILLMLIACISLMSVLSPKATESEITDSTDTKAISSNSSVTASMVAVIQAAVHHYRASSNR
ncbi:MAG: OadG family protein [Gammaproteobacteria bacterium]|nr:OadG family protein [Gammaproteobacteria bacterium]